MRNEDTKKLGWEDICIKDCHSPFMHAHQFVLGKNIKKTCPNCKRKMAPDAKIYATEFGQDRCALYNFYECKDCHYTDRYDLYDGKTRGCKDIYQAAQKYIESQIDVLSS